MKVSMVDGQWTVPVYKFLKENAKIESIPWNFAKFLVNADGDVVAYYPPQKSVEEIKEEVKALIWEWKN